MSPSTLRFLLPLLLLPAVSALYFVVNSPAKGDQWVNGQTWATTWSKGLDDDLDSFDIEIQRLSTDGTIFIASNVAALSGSLNINLNDVPAADDYFLSFINSTHGVLYGTSKTFSVLDSSSTSNTSQNVDSSVPTVSISGGPNPTALFATTFASNSKRVFDDALPMHILAFAIVAVTAVAGGAAALL